MGILKSLPMDFVVTNALLVATPLEAMAETCEAEQSLFNMNMPLLLLVALIGATVGGLLARQRMVSTLSCKCAVSPGHSDQRRVKVVKIASLVALSPCKLKMLLEQRSHGPVLSLWWFITMIHISRS